MLELGVGADIVRGIGAILWGILAIALLVALITPKSIKAKALSSLLVLGIFFGPMVPGAMRAYEYKQRYAKAKALFDERCKTAGEKIYRTLEGVDGVVWIKWRPAGLNREQFALDDPYGKDCSMEGCILRLLSGNEDRTSDQGSGIKSPIKYKFVETINPTDGVRYRYTGILKAIADVPKEQFLQHVQSTGYGANPNGLFLSLQREPIKKFSAQFGILWSDVSVPEDREYWIAGGALKIMDIQTNEVIAERVGYLIDTGQGSTAGARDPWGWAQSYAPKCPGKLENTTDFAMRVLQPKR